MGFTTYPVLGIPVVASTFDAAVAQLEAWAMACDRAYGVSFADVHVIARGRHDPDFGGKLKRLDAVMPDGRPVLWSVNRHLRSEDRLEERLSGPDMFRRLQDHSNQRPRLRHFYLGGSNELLRDLLLQVGRNCPGLEIAGSYSPPFGDWPTEEIRKMIDLIRSSGANIVWVGLGCPKQEAWISDQLAELSPGVYLAVGAAFAFYTGRVKRAPLWMQNFHLEWLHRLMSEPRRLWKRYFIYNSLFIFYTFLAILGFSSSNTQPTR